VIFEWDARKDFGQRAERMRIIGARPASRARSARNMKKASNRKPTSDLRPEYDLSRLGSGVRGKYYKRATSGSNLVLIEPDLAVVFPDAKSVNRALRLLADAAQAARDPK
jgi:hypothetical protein